MMFFEKIKEIVYVYRTSLIMWSVIIFVILISNFFTYYVLKYNISNNASNNEVVYLESEQEIKKVDEIKEEIYYKVDVKGAVKKAGVYELKEKSRIIDAINSAGGLNDNADTSVTNLSKYVGDEMVIVIYTKEEVDKFKEVKQEEIKKEEQCVIYNDVIINDSCTNNDLGGSKEEINDSNKSEVDVKISINTADIELLMTLPGVGESKAKSIIEYREKTPFTKIEDIMNVSGIGEKAFEQIKEYITV